MADFFGRSQFGSHYFGNPGQGNPAPHFNPGFEQMPAVESQVLFSKGLGAKGRTTEMVFRSGPVHFTGVRKRRRHY